MRRPDGVEVEIVSEGYEGESVSAHILDRSDQVLEAPPDTVKLPAHNRIKSYCVGGCEHSVELRAGFPGSAYADVDEFGGDFRSAAGGIFTEFGKLHFRVLAVESGDLSVDCDALAGVVRGMGRTATLGGSHVALLA
jgi:hypothetical protein